MPWGDPAGKPTSVELIVTSREGRACNRNYLNPKIWKVALAEVGVPDKRSNGMHCLRHSFGSWLLRSSVDAKSISTWVGHADPGFTLKVYAHPMPDAAQQGRSAIDAIVTGESATLLLQEAD